MGLEGRAGSKKGDVQMEKGGKTQTGESRHLVGELSSYRTRVTRNLSVATRGFHIPHTAGLRSSLENMLKSQDC